MRNKLRRQIALFTILTIVFSFHTLIIPSVCTNIQDGWIRISCFTQNRLSLDYIAFRLIVYENNAILLLGSTQFEAIGSETILTITIDSSGRNPSTPFGEITSDVAFSVVNGSDLYIGSYYETYQVNATVENGAVHYEIDFTNNVGKAMNAIYPQGTLEDFGIKGIMDFEVEIGNSVAFIQQKRFFRVSLDIHADLSSVFFDITLPKTADIKDAKKGEQNMLKMTSYNAYTFIDVTPLEDTLENLYLEWEMPPEVPLPMRYPYNIIITIILSLVVGWIGRYTYERMRSWHARA